MTTPQTQELTDRYLVNAWGEGYFRVDEEGFARVSPEGPHGPSVRMTAIIEDLRRRGFRSPFLLRFPQILQDRVIRLNEGFKAAIDAFHYPNTYQGVYPVKVNQQKVVVQHLMRESHRHRYGLEVGSKGELVLALTQELHQEALIICNGFKDRDFIELALRANKASTRVILIAETIHEVQDLVAIAKEIGVEPEVGFRARLNSRGAGKWQESGGAHAKFGLSTLEILEAVRILDTSGYLNSLRLLHFHVGSQISDILAIKEAVKEATRLFCHIKRRAPRLSILDVGGGLGVDYDGSSTASDWSQNYDLDEYCRDIVYNVLSVCEQEEVEPPMLVSESGRAVTAFHAVLVASPIKLNGRTGREPIPMPKDPCLQVEEMAATLADMSRENWRERVNDARPLHEEVLLGFKMGFLTLEDRAVAEALFADICRRALELLDPEEEDPEEVARLRDAVAPTMVCNFSVFQSAPDTWAVRQVFPIIPLSRLNDADVLPMNIGDITCDSDGVIDEFMGETGTPQRTMMLPRIDLEAPYEIGIFLVGAYQDTLGDFHNLFGCANEVAVFVTGPDEFQLGHSHRGTTVSEALDMFGYERQQLVSHFDDRHGGDDSAEAVRYRDCFLRVLSSGTYLRR